MMKIVLNVAIAVMSFIAAGMWFWSARAKVTVPGDTETAYARTMGPGGAIRTLQRQGADLINVEATAALAADWNRRAAFFAGLAAALQGVVSCIYAD